MNRLHGQAPVLQLSLRIDHYLLQLRSARELLPLFARHDGRIVQQIEDATSLPGENDLLLGTLDDGRSA